VGTLRSPQRSGPPSLRISWPLEDAREGDVVFEAAVKSGKTSEQMVQVARYGRDMQGTVDIASEGAMPRMLGHLKATVFGFGRCCCQVRPWLAGSVNSRHRCDGSGAALVLFSRLCR
jgi:hypothetical protein